MDLGNLLFCVGLVLVAAGAIMLSSASGTKVAGSTVFRAISIIILIVGCLLFLWGVGVEVEPYRVKWMWRKPAQSQLKLALN